MGTIHAFELLAILKSAELGTAQLTTVVDRLVQIEAQKADDRLKRYESKLVDIAFGDDKIMGFKPNKPYKKA